MSRKLDVMLTTPDSASASWVLHVAHGVQDAPTKKTRMVVMDNFCTWPDLEEQIRKLTEDGARILGTVLLNNLDLINRVNVRQAVEVLKDAPRRNWYLCRTYLSIAPTTRRRGVPRSEVTSAKVAENCGFIVWTDRNIVTFYGNELAKEPQDHVCPRDFHLIMGMHGIVEINRWQGNEAPHPAIIKTPSIVHAYNLFMNGADRFDQLRASHSTMR